jgi:hypothetical protein
METNAQNRAQGGGRQSSPPKITWFSAYVEISADKDDLALKISLAQVTNRLLGHGSDNTRAFTLQIKG